jgi:hypothetical protein
MSEMTLRLLTKSIFTPNDDNLVVIVVNREIDNNREIGIEQVESH